MISNHTKWHINKKKEIIKRYPYIKNYEGPFYFSFIIIILLSLFQWYSAYLIYIYDLNIFTIFILSFLNSNSLYHSLGSFIHENSHGLVLGYDFKDIVSIVLELGLTTFGQHMTYEYTHVKYHHVYLNITNLDTECTNDNHISNLTNITNNKYINRILYLLDLFPLGSILTQECLKKKQNKITIQNSIQQFCVILSTFVLLYLFYFQFYKIILFKIWSLSIYQGKFSIFRRGQSISEHYSQSNITNGYNNNPTKSTYNLIENLFGFNTGYHDEHHTFPTIPWYYLPTVKNIAPEYFTNKNKLSYISLWFNWIKSDFKDTFYRSCK